MKKKPTIKKLQKYQNGNEVDYIPSLANIFSQGLGLSPNISNPGGNPFGNIPFGDQITSGVFNAGKSLLDSGITSPKNLNYEDFLKQYGYNDDFLSKTKYQAYKMSEGVVNTKNQDALVKNLPLAANMFAIDELNKLTEKSYNQGLKLDAQDLTKGTKGQEFRGFFAKDGMRVGNFQNSGGVYPNFNQRVSPQDSVRNMFYNSSFYESQAGGARGNPIGSYGNPNLKPGATQDDAADWYMENTYPLVEGKYQSAMETSAAGDLAYNAGREARVYMLDQYLKRYKGDAKGLPGRGGFNKDIKSDDWKNKKGPEFEAIWTQYKDEIEALPEQQRRELINNGRDYYYKNTFNDKGGTGVAGVDYWSKTKKPDPSKKYFKDGDWYYEYGPDGTLSPAYAKTWYGRQHASDQYEDIRPIVADKKHPRHKDIIRKEDGGSTEYPFLNFLSSSRDNDKIKSYIKRNEGSVIDSNGNHIMYPDSEGYSTVGYGHLMRGVESPILSQKSADQYFDRDYELHKKHAEKIPGFSRLDSNQKAALIDMTFNMGPEWYKKFPKFTKALEAGDLDRATSELRDSLWAKQVGPRAERNIDLIGGNRMSSITNREQGGSIKALHRSMGADTGLPHAGLGGFLKSVGKGIVNSVHDLGVGIADGFGNSTGLYDINNDKYKTGFGQNVAGFANTMSATTGKIGRAIASAAVPGVGGAAAGALSSLGGAMNPQGVAQAPPHYVPPQQNQQMDWLKMLSANPQIISQFMGFLQGPQYGKGVGGYESGGQINQLQQIMGYKDGSPFANLPFQTINSNSITMDGVSQPLLAIADNGERRVMQPNSGLHNFQGANSVLEVPMGSYQDGGSANNLDQMYSDIPYLFGSPDYLNNKIINRFKSIVDDDKIERLPDIVKHPLRYLHKSNGSPMLVDNEGVRSYYQTNKNTAHIRPGDIGDYLAELSHASQKILPNRRAKDIEMVQKEFNTGKYKTWQDAYDAIMYTTPGTTEYEAHSEIQPKLEEEFMSYLDRGLWANHTTPEISRVIKPIKSNRASRKQQGGKITSPINLSKNINPFRLSPINSFGLGGFIRDGVPSRPKSEVGFSRQPISGATTKGPMGPKATDIPSYNGGVRKLMDMPDNEYISTENLITIQTEKGEMIVMPTGDLVKVMATKRHHQMDEDEVTDVAPEGAYILSSFGKVRINKDEAEQIITETGVKPYRIGGIQDSPTEKNLASMMTKKSMAPADIAKRVDRFFPVNSTSNPFELAANNENKTHRVPYLEGLIQLSELDKLRKGIDSGMESQQQENEDEMTQAFKNGGSTWGGVPMRNMLIPKFQSSGGVPPVDPWSAVIQAGTGLIQTGADLWNSYQQRKAQKEFVKKGTFLSDTAYGKARNEMGMGYLAGMLGVMNQDPTVTAKYNDPTYLRQMQTRTPMSTLEAISNRSYANMPNYMQNAPTWQAGLGAQQAAYAAALKGANDARLTIGEQDRNAQNDWLKLMQTNLELNNNNRVEAVNATRLNRNQQVGALGNQTQGYMDSLANATLGQLSNQLSLEGVRANANVNFSNNIANSIKGGVQTIGTAGISYLDSRNKTTPTYNSGASYGSGVGTGYGGTGPSTPGYTCVGGSQYAINLDGSLVPTGKGCSGYGSGVGTGYGGTGPSTPGYTCVGGSQYAINLDGSLVPTGKGC